MSSDLVRVKRGPHPWVTEPESGGGALQTITQSFTTDPDSFVGASTFDLGSVAVASAVGVVTAIDADGETFGSADGDLVGVFQVVSSMDGLVAAETEPNIGPAEFAQGYVSAVDENTGAVVRMTSRYIIVGIDIDVLPNFDLYAGANHPTMTVEVTITYRS